MKFVYLTNEFNEEGYIELLLPLIIEFEYFKKYNRKYEITNYYLMDGAKEFVKDIELKWIHNKLDEDKYVTDDEFKNYLLKYHYDELHFPEHEDDEEEIRSAYEDYDVDYSYLDDFEFMGD